MLLLLAPNLKDYIHFWSHILWEDIQKPLVQLSLWFLNFTNPKDSR